MSSKENISTAEKIAVSAGTLENQALDPGTQSTMFLSNGHKEVTDLNDSSTSRLLKTIVIGQQQGLSTPADTNQTMENPLHDLNNLKTDQFAQLLNTAQNSQQQQSPQLDQQQNAQFVFQGLSEMNTTPANINGVNPNLLADYVKSPTSKHVSESLHVNTDHSPLQTGVGLNVTSNMQSFESLNTHTQQSPDYNIEKAGVLHRLLSGDNLKEQNLHVSIQSNSFTVSSPTDYSKSSPTSSGNSPYGDSNLSPFTDASQSISFMDTDHQTTALKDLPKTITISDTTTQSSLITNTVNLRLDPMIENNTEAEMKYDVTSEWNVTKLEEDLNCSNVGKVPRLLQDSDASSALSPTVDNVFRAESAQQEVPSDFTFQLFGQGETEQNPVGVFSNIISENEVSSSQDPSTVPTVAEQPFKTPQTLPHNVVKQQRERLRRSKEPILSQAFPAKFHGYELRILQQPEEQHRARYLTEGSRGSVKNRSGNSYPQVKLFGHTGEATLQIFIGNDSGRVRPHGFYQSCKVCGKNSTQCMEKDIDGTTVIEIELQAANDMTAAVDCVGILKLRNADVEQRIGITKAKKKSTKARMIFRVTFQKPCGNPQVLQVASSTILCTQPIGQPEICKMSLKECVVTGGDDLFIIGKNFMRGTQVLFQQVAEDDTGQVTWEKEAVIDKDYFQTTHMIVSIPEYSGSPFSGSSVECQVIVNSGGKLSDPQPFFFKPVDPSTMVIKQDIMDTTEESRKRNYPFVAPEALELNQQIQQVQQVSCKTEMFQLPPGIISSISDSKYSPMDQDSREENPDGKAMIDKRQGEDLDLERSHSYEQKAFAQESMETPTRWDPDHEGMLNTDSKKNDLNVDLNSLNFPSMNTEEFGNQSMENSFGQLKSNESFPAEHMGLSNAPRSDDSIVSQFLQNISMALKQSDPMLSGNETAMSNSMTGQSNTVLTTVNNHLVMAPDTRQSHLGSGLTEKSQTLEHSFLKEALTCPAASLANIGSITNQSQPTAMFVPKTENVLSDMAMQVDSLNTSLGPKIEEVMEYNTSTTVSANTQALNTSYTDSESFKLPETTQFSNTPAAPVYSSDTIQNLQSAMPFSPSQILTSLQVTEAKVADLKPVLSIASSFTANTVQSTLQRMPEGHQTFTHESPSHQKTIMSTVEHSQTCTPLTIPTHLTGAPSAIPTNLTAAPALQTNLTGAPAVPTHLSAAPSAIPTHLTGAPSALPSTVEQSLHHRNGQHTSLGQQLKSPGITQTDPISTILQQMLSQSKQQQQQQQAFAPQQQQQQFQQHSEHGNQQQQFQQHAEHVNHQQQQQQQLLFQNEQQQFQQQQTLTQTQEQQQTLTQTQEQQQKSLQQQLLQLMNQSVGQQQQQQPNQQQQQQAPTVLMAPSPIHNQPGVTEIKTETGQTLTTASVPNPSQNPSAPQIIICNNPTPQGQIPQSQYGSPSIVIVPGQSGANNQVENLLRSILGSMMQPQQQPQQQQQQQQQMQPPQ